MLHSEEYGFVEEENDKLSQSIQKASSHADRMQRDADFEWNPSFRQSVNGTRGDSPTDGNSPSRGSPFSSPIFKKSLNLLGYAILEID